MKVRPDRVGCQTAETMVSASALSVIQLNET
jgi:hypothetical protein